MKLKGLIRRLRKANIHLSLNGEDIEIHFNDESIPPNLLLELKECKQELISYLKLNQKEEKSKIEKQEKLEDIPLSYNQDRLWFLDRLSGTENYHISSVFRIDGPVDYQLLKNVFRHIVQRHEILRTIYYEHNGVGYQKVLSHENWQFSSQIEVQGKTKEEIIRIKEEEIAKPFNLTSDYMLRVNLLKVTDDCCYLVLVMHHIASDGWSMPILTREFQQLYRDSSGLNAIKDNLPQLPIQFTDYAIWEKKHLSGGLLKDKLLFWKEKLSEVSPLLLRTDFRRPKVQRVEGRNMYTTIDENVKKKLLALSQKYQTTLYTIVLSIFKTFLFKQTKQEDICVGTPVVNRDDQHVEQLIGYFVNTLALRTQLTSEMSFSEVVESVKQTVLESFEHQEIPFNKVVKEVVSTRELSHSPLFQIMFAYQNYFATGSIAVGNLEVKTEPMDRKATKFDLSCNISETKAGLRIEWEYRTDLYKRETVEVFTQQFMTLIHHVLENNQLKLDAYSLTSQDQLKRLETFNDTDQPLPQENTIIELFEKQVNEHPKAVALSFKDQTLTYQELDEQSVKVAHYIHEELGLQNGQVGVFLDRSFDMVIALLGIIRSGNAYVPIDPEHPISRQEYIIENAEIKTVLTNELSHAKAVLLPCETVTIQSILTTRKESNRNTLPQVERQTNAYVIYTSGTTGTPKGVINSHAGLLNRIQWAQDFFQLKQSDIVLQKTTYTFDVSVWEFLLPLISGSKLEIAQPEGHKDNDYLEETICSKKVTTLHFVPSMFDTFLNNWKGTKSHSLKRILCSGEALENHHVEAFQSIFGEDVELFNLYGPTEAAIDVSCWKVPSNFNADKDRVVIGSPVMNTKLHVVDSNINRCGIGILGELLIEGIQVAKGYINRPELTQERFVQNTIYPENGGRLYRTGDLARWLPNGTIEYLGRNDDQVKINGNRIELGEIKNSLVSFSEISQAEALVKKHHGKNVLVAYYTMPNTAVGKKELRERLKGLLPDYMIPHYFISIDEFPMTTSGKVDKKALTEIQSEDVIREVHAAIEGELEVQIVQAWEEILGIEVLSAYDNFFELGGDSILVLQVVSRLRKLGFDIYPKDMFVAQTVRSLAQSIQKIATKVMGEQGQLEGTVPLLPIQSNYLNHSQSSHFNQSILFYMNKQVSSTRLNAVVQELFVHHDTLRISFQLEDNTWIQSYSNYQGTFEEVDLHDVKQEELTDAIASSCDSYQRSLDISTGKVACFVRINTPETEEYDRFFIVLHHLATDGVSWRILLRDLEERMQKNDQTTAEKGTSYRQWAEYLMNVSETLSKSNELNYWKNLVDHFSELPTDKSLTERYKKEVIHYTNQLAAKETESLLRDVHLAFNTEINDILLTALGKTLQEWTGRETNIVGLEGHGRNYDDRTLDITNTMGWFTALYPVKLGNSSSGSLAEDIKFTKENLRKIPNHGLGYGCLKYLSKNEEIQKQFQQNDPWEITFNYLGQSNEIEKTGDFSLSQEPMGASISEDYIVPNKIEVNILLVQGQMKFIWNYSAEEYEQETINSLANNYLQNLTNYIHFCVEQKETERTPSDFGLQEELSYQELDAFFHQQEGDVITDIYPLSPLQEGLLFHHLQDSMSYVQQLVVDIESEINIEVFKKAWKQLLQDHSILRSNVLYDVFQIPVQCVYDKVVLPFYHKNFSKEYSQTDFDAFLESDLKEGFDFAQAPLFRINLLQFDAIYKLVITFHHIILDGWSLPILIKKFQNTYSELSNGQVLSAYETDNYKDCIDFVRTKNNNDYRTFWSDYLNDLEHATLLPFVRKSSQIRSEELSFSTTKLVLDEQTNQALNAFAQKNSITPNTILQGVWAILLSKYVNSHDVVFGVTTSGRPTELHNIENRVGLYINTIPFRAQINHEIEIIEWFKELQSAHSEAREYQYNTLNQIQGFTGVQGTLFDTLLIYENYPVSEMVLEDSALKIKGAHLREETNYPLTLVVISGKTLEIRFKYNSLIDSFYINNLVEQLKMCIEQLLSTEKLQIGEINLFSSDAMVAEVEKVSYPKDITIIDLFDKQAQATPENIAVVVGNEQLTYQQLDERSNALANYILSQQEIHSDDLIGIKLERNLDLIVSIIGVLKSGAAYVPIDPDYPESRIQYIEQDSQCKLVIDNAFFASFKNSNSPTTQPNVSIYSNDLMYIIYTSGTSGNPKGVMIEHQNVVRLFFNDTPLFDFDSNDIWTLFHSYCFDFSIWEIFGALLFGGKLVIIPSIIAKDPFEFIPLLQKEGVTILNQTPSSFLNLLSTEELLWNASLSLRYVIFGGEALYPSQLSTWKDHYPKVRMINMYGITETTVHVTYREINEKDIEENISNIGKSIPSLSCYILDDNLQPLPVGSIGELHVTGAGVSRGYLYREELTKEKFVPNPFEEGERMYRTGDLVRMLPDGTLVYVGRKDRQIQLRGYRIESGEIERMLLNHEDIDNAIVLLKEDSQGDKSLNAYIATKIALDVTDLRTYLSQLLPSYMIPAYIIALESFPRTANGKIDIKVLSNTQKSDQTTTKLIVDELEKEIEKVWCSVLSISSLHKQNHFFNLGGDSIKVVRLVGQLNKILQLQVEVSTVFKYPIFADFAEYIRTLQNQEKQQFTEAIYDEWNDIKEQFLQENSLSESSIEDVFPASEIQKGMIYHSLVNQGVYHDQMVHFVGYSEAVFTHFERALHLIAQRHEILRTSFGYFQEDLYQQVHKHIDVHSKIQRYDLRYLDDQSKFLTIKETLLEDKIAPLNIEEPGLFRLLVFQLDKESYCIGFVCHHAIIDGWSDASFNTEMHNTLLALSKDANYQPIKLKSSYKDYVTRELLKIKDKKVEKFWHQELEDHIPHRFGSFDKEKIRKFVDQKIDITISNSVDHVAESLGITSKHVYFASFIYALSRFSYHKNISVGVITNNRPPVEDGDKILGCFLNTLPFRYKVPSEIDFHEFLHQIDDKLRFLRDYDAYPFGKMIRDIIPANESGQSRIDDVIFSYTDFHIYSDLTQKEQIEFPLKQYYEDVPLGGVTNNSAFSLVIDHTQEQVKILLSYDTNFIDEQTVDQFLNCYVNLLEKTRDQQDFEMSAINLFSSDAMVTETKKVDYPKDLTIVDLFDKQAQKTPENIAVVVGEEQLTYQQLDEQSNALANYLLSQQEIHADDLIGIKLERNLDLIVSIIGVLKSGAAYVPIDPDYPESRIEYIEQDSQCKLVIDDAFFASFKNSNSPTTKPKVHTSNNDLMYIIYTSGTSGNPKGVMIEHQNVVRLFFNDEALFDFDSNDVWTLFHSYCFDLSIWEIFGALLFGGKLVIVPSMIAKDPFEFIPLLEKEGVTILNQTPSSFLNLLSTEELLWKASLSLRYVIFGGEALYPSQLSEWKEQYPKVRMINMYGITETTVHVTYREINEQDIEENISNIGKSIPTLSCYILDGNLQPLPIGSIGELHVTGAGVSRGYLHREELTKEKFIPNPFEAVERMYRTGDLAKMLPDGTLEYIGRKDRQIQLRGYRIELGEVESVLLSHEEIQHAIVMGKTSKDLVAYIQAKEEVSTEKIRRFLQEQLPSYMVPNHLISLAQLPLTANGKIDKSALPKVEAEVENNTQTNKIEPRNEFDRQLIQIWQEVLEQESIGIEDNFFEIGGHSLKATAIILKIRETFHLEVGLGDFLVNPTIYNLSDMIGSVQLLSNQLDTVSSEEDELIF